MFPSCSMPSFSMIYRLSWRVCPWLLTGVLTVEGHDGFSGATPARSGKSQRWVGGIIMMSGERRDDTGAHLPVACGDEFSGPTGGTTVGPHIIKDDAKPEKSEQHQRREEQV